MELHRHCVDCLTTLTSLGSACLQESIRNMRGKAKCLVPCSLQPSQKDKRKKEFGPNSREGQSNELWTGGEYDKQVFKGPSKK